MTCARAREQIVRLDHRETPPAQLAQHIAICSGCRLDYERLQVVEAAARVGVDLAREGAPPAGSSPAGSAFTARVMRAVHESKAQPEPARSTVGIPGWTAGGAVLIASLVAVQFSQVVEWLGESLGPVLDVALATILGLALTIYILILVGSNLRAMRRALRWFTR